jgi:hypothetical protein
MLLLIAFVVILVAVSGMLENLPRAIFCMALLYIEHKLNSIDLVFRGKK